MHLEKLSDLVWGWPTVIIFLGIGGLFTFGSGVLPIRCLPKALKLIRPKGKSEGISAYGALCTALAATIGTGNIVGVATALSAGGPGALFWMLIAAFLGMGTQFAEGYLGAKYRIREGTAPYGGPFAYIEGGLGKRFSWMGKLFALIGAAVGLLGVGTITQVNSITSAVEGYFQNGEQLAIFGKNYSVAALVSGALVTVGAATVLFGGAKRITEVCQSLVPVMTAIYVLCSVLILIRYGDKIPAALNLIIRSAFAPKAVLGASAGIGIKAAMRMGIGRGVFTNEAGLGTAGIAAAASDEQDPYTQGLISMTGTFIDTIVICTLTGLCLVVTGAWNMPLEGVEITDYAWRTGLGGSGSVASLLLLICLCLFAFATIIGWNFYSNACLRYLVGENKRISKLYRLGYLLMVVCGIFISVSSAWALADILNVLMAGPNLLALFLLSGRVLRDQKLHRNGNGK